MQVASDRPKTKTYFPGLHGLRFIAAFGVVLHHTGLATVWSGLPFHFSNFFAAFLAMVGFQGLVEHLPSAGPALATLGPKCVDLFFTLSGFLITYLLLNERAVTGKISISKFYIRRALRIWPLYYLIVFLAFFVLPRFPFFRLVKAPPVVMPEFWRNLTGFLLLSPQLVVSWVVFFGAPLVTIGIEEHFYGIWPHLVKRFQNHTGWLLGCLFFVPSFVAILPLSKTFAGQYLVNCRWESLAAGGFAAWLFFSKQETILRFLYHRTCQFLTFGMAVFLWIRGRDLSRFQHEVTAALFAVIILNVATNPKRLLSLENRFFFFMGELSYGMYCFNWIAIVTTIGLYKKLELTVASQGAVSDFAIEFSCVLVTIALSAGSYYLIEKQFLKLKPTFSTVLSGRDAHSESPKDLALVGQQLTNALPL